MNTDSSNIPPASSTPVDASIHTISIAGASLIASGVPSNADVEIALSTNQGDAKISGCITGCSENAVTIALGQSLQLRATDIRPAGSAKLADLLRQTAARKGHDSAATATTTGLLKAVVDALLQGRRSSSILSSHQLRALADYCDIGLVDLMIIEEVLSPNDLHRFVNEHIAVGLFPVSD